MGAIPSANFRRNYYATQYAACTLNPGVLDQVKAIAEKAALNVFLYEQIGFPYQVPWQAIAAIHQMECNLDTGLHLANGDPLTADTVHTPKHLMAPSPPPYEFVDAGIAALLNYRNGWGSLNVGDVVSTLQFCEQWNGLGYWELDPPQPSPYLWAGTSVYTSGKFASDGVYDPSLVSKQIGIAAILKGLGLS